MRSPLQCFFMFKKKKKKKERGPGCCGHFVMQLFSTQQKSQQLKKTCQIKHQRFPVLSNCELQRLFFFSVCDEARHRVLCIVSCRTILGTICLLRSVICEVGKNTETFSRWKKPHVFHFKFNDAFGTTHRGSKHTALDFNPLQFRKKLLKVSSETCLSSLIGKLTQCVWPQRKQRPINYSYLFCSTHYLILRNRAHLGFLSQSIWL